MNRIIIFLSLLTAAIIAGCSSTESGDPLEIFVSVNGNDRNNGSVEAPFQTLAGALRSTRELRRLGDPSIESGILIILEKGTHRLDETLVIRPEDSGTESSPTVIRSAGDAGAVLSGGIIISGWEKLDRMPDKLPTEAKGKIWAARIPMVWGEPIDFRQMWVNGSKAQRASNLDDDSLDRILSVDKVREEIWIPVPKVKLVDGFNKQNEVSQFMDNTSRLEFVIHQWWAIANLRVKSLEVEGDKACLKFLQPESRIEFEHPWPAPFIDSNKEYEGNSAFFFVNDIALLNHPGEWYRDHRSGMLYYWPYESEDMSTAEVVVPVLETLVHFEGSLDHPVSHIRMEGIGFEHTTWMRPSHSGHVPLQAGMYLYDAYKLKEPGTPDKASLENQAWLGRQPAAISLNGAHNISLNNCSFSHLAATGLDMISGTWEDEVENCVFSDIGGTAIQIGFFGSQSFEAHVPYDPSDKREVCRYIKVSNNLITDCTNEDWGCVGISVGYAHDINIEYNEVSHLNYSGICLGWGWTSTKSCLKNNRVHANYIHHFAKQMYDVGGIYTLSAQPGTILSNNRIEALEKAPYAHIPEHYQYIYFDEGSSYISAIDNWTEEDRFFSNTPGPGNEWINNGPTVSEEIKLSAGRK